MKAKVKDFWIYNAASSLEGYRPENEDCFVLYLNITVSPLLDDGCGTCDFQLAICNPEWVRRQCDIHGAIWGRHMMVVPSYDLDMIKRLNDATTLSGKQTRLHGASVRVSLRTKGSHLQTNCKLNMILA